MFSWINIRVFSLAQTIVLAGAQYPTETCVETEHARKSAELLCSGGYICGVSVQSGTGKCLEKNGRCYGMTPSLLVDQLNCYWHRTCVINWPSEPIIYTEIDRTGRTCIGRLPTFMSIRYKCFKTTEHLENGGLVSLSQNRDQPKRLLIDVCGDFESERSVYSNDVGIIRSHKFYPWDYSNKPRNCVVKLYGPEKLMLYVTVQGIDLSEDDHLIIENGDGQHTQIRESGLHYVFSNEAVISFNFSVGAESNSGKGFLLCFRLTSNTDGSLTNVCDSIMTDGIVSNTRPVADDPFAQEISKTSVVPTQSANELPTRCKRKKTEKARRKCASRTSSKRRKNRRKNRERGNKKRRQGKRDRRKRRHSIRRNKVK